MALLRMIGGVAKMKGLSVCMNTGIELIWQSQLKLATAVRRPGNAGSLLRIGSARLAHVEWLTISIDMARRRCDA